MSTTPTNPKAIAIIPARGGSKGLPRKNVRMVAGKPLIAWTIEAALAAKTVDRVIVSTDDAEIAQVATEFGAQVVHRPAELSNDTASSESALLHVLEQMGITKGVLVFLQCTSPLTIGADIDGTVNALIQQQADSALSVTPFHYFVWNRNVEGINHDKRVRPRRQDREPQWLETGAVYAMQIEGFREHQHRFFGKTAMYEMPAERVLEIDESLDLEMAEARLRKRISDNRLSALPANVRAVVFDFDGIFTDNRFLLDQFANEYVTCDRSDGHGIAMLGNNAIKVLVLSGEAHPVVQARCQKLKIECIHGCSNKLPALRKWLAHNSIEPRDTVYIGNDVNDMECLAAAGCGVTVPDAHRDVLPAANMILENPGGKGAVRELCDLVLKRNQNAQSNSGKRSAA